MRSFRLLDLTLTSPAENLALDEALLDDLDEHGGDPVLRFWESPRPFVVLGFGSRLLDDVDIAACQTESVPVLRRSSGGGTVLLGPGCLSYAFVLPLTWHRDLMSIRTTNQLILKRTAKALRRWEPAIACEGISDLAIDGWKVSGNAQRRKRHALLFHGTILYGMQVALISRYLKHPARQPDYRADRPHAEFLRTIAAPPLDIKQAIADAWCARPMLQSWPDHRMTGSVLTVMQRSAEERA